MVVLSTLDATTIVLGILNLVQVLGLAFIGSMFQRQNGTLKELGDANDRLKQTIDYRLAQQHRGAGSKE